MRIVCPNCDAAYEVPPSVLAPDRPVRCARCGQDWAPVASPSVAPPPRTVPAAETPVVDLRRIRSLPVVPLPPAPGEAPPIAATPMPDAPAPDAPAPDAPAPDAPALPVAPRVQVPVLAGWILSVLVLLGAAWAAYAWRAEIMQAWPPSARVYTVLGVTQR